MKKMSKLFLVILAVVMALCVSAVGASAIEEETIEVTFTEADDAATVLASALEIAEEDGATVVITLNANMVFTEEDVTIGESKESHKGLVKIQSAVDSEGAPLYGIEVGHKVIVNCYGNFAFDNIQYIYNIPEGTSFSWSSGGCFQFTEGLGVWGKDGVIECTPEKRVHLAGKIEVYSGSYSSLSGNYYYSGVEVVNPSVHVAGDVVADYAFSGAHNGSTSSNKVSGTGELYIGGNARISKAAIGSWYSATNSIGGTGTVEGSVKIDHLALVAGSANRCEFPLYTLNVYGGTLGTVESVMANGPGTYSTVNGVFNLNMTSGSIGTFFGGIHSNFTSISSAKEYSESGTATKIFGNIVVNIDSLPNCESFRGGSYLRAAGSIHAADVTINVNGAALQCAFIGGSYIGDTFVYKQTGVDDGEGGTKTVSTTINNANCEHSGKITLNLTNGASLTNKNYPTDTKAGKALYVGSYVSGKDSKHSGEIIVNAKITEESNATFSIELSDSMWLGSDLRGTNNVHSGNITATLEDVYPNLRTTSWAAIAGGSYNHGTNTDHSGDSNVTIIRLAVTSKGLVGGCYLNSSSAKHSGDSVLTLIDVTKYSGNIAAGSVLGSTGCEHSGNSTLALKYSGTYGKVYESGSYGAPNITGGSYFNTNGVKHSGTSTLEIWGSIADASGVFPSTLNFFGNIQAGSTQNSKYGEQSGDSFLILRDLKNDGGSAADNFTSNRASYDRFYAGSILSNTGKTNVFKFTGNTTAIIRRCEIPYIVYGGCYLDGYNHATGDSKIILEGNIALNADGTESEGTGYNYIRSQIRGGNNVAGYVSSTENGLPVATGKTSVEIIAGPYASGAPINHKTVLTTRVYGGNDYAARVAVQQTSDSTVTFVKGTVNYTGTPEIIPGPIYNGQTVRTSTATAENMPTFKTVINQGAYFGGTLYAGGYIDCKTNTNYYNHSAIIVYGGAGTNFTVGHRMADASRYATQVGNAVIEFGAPAYTAKNANISMIGINTTRAAGYKSYIKFLDAPSNIADWTVAAVDVLDLYRCSGSTAAITSKVTATTTFNPFVDGVTVTLSNKSIANGTKFADFMKGQTVTIGADTYAYNDLTAFDAYTDADNAFDFYTTQFGAEQKVEVLDVFNKVKVGEGADRSAEITLTNTSRDTGIHGHISGVSLTLSDSIAINMAGKNTLFDNYSDVRVKVIFNGEEYIYEAPTTKGDTTFQYSFTNVGPQMMGDTAYFMIYAKNASGNEVTSGILNSSVRKYAIQQMSSASAAAEFKTVCMDLLNYGAEAQVYGKYKTDALVNTGSDIEAYKQYASATEAVPATVKKIDRIDAPTVSVKGPSLYLGNNVELRFAYQTAEKLEELSAVVVIGEDTVINVPFEDFTVTNADTGAFYVTVNQLNPAMMRDTVKVTIMKGETAISHSITYSIASYVYDQAAAGTTGTLMNAVKAMLTYGDAVAAWQA